MFETTASSDRLSCVNERAPRRRHRHLVSEPGLTDAEFLRVEEALGFEFADDHRAFLAAQFSTAEEFRRRVEKLHELEAER